MSDSGSSSNDCAQKQALAFGQRVKQTVPNDHLNNSISYGDVTFHNPLCDSRFKKVPVTVIYAQEPHLGKPPDLPKKARLQSPRSSNQSEIKIVQVLSTAVEKDSNSINNSHQHSNLLELAGQIMPADNSSNNDVSQTVQTQESLVHSEAVAMGTNGEGKAHINKYVAKSSEKTTEIKATRLERQKERQRERYKTDPVYAERQRERQRELRKDPVYVERENKRKKERRRELCKDTVYAERRREHQKERYQTDPVYAERQRERQKERQRERRKDPAYVERERKRKRERYQTDFAYAERERERQRELRKDPVYAERQRVRQRVRYQTDPAFAERQRERQRKRLRERQKKRYQADPAYQRKSKKQCCQSVNSAKTQVISR